MGRDRLGHALDVHFAIATRADQSAHGEGRRWGLGAKSAEFERDDGKMALNVPLGAVKDEKSPRTRIGIAECGPSSSIERNLK